MPPRPTRREALALVAFTLTVWGCLLGPPLAGFLDEGAAAEQGTKQVLGSNEPLRVWVYPLAAAQVIDADTLRGELRVTPDLALANAVRVAGIDTPESTFRATDNPAEVEVGKLVKQVTERWVGHHLPLRVEFVATDKYGGRIVGHVWGEERAGARGQGPGSEVKRVSLAAYLLEHELALPYDGGTKTEWTAARLNRAKASAEKLLAENKTTEATEDPEERYSVPSVPSVVNQ